MQKVLLIICLFFVSSFAVGQSMPIGQAGTDEILRVLQLTGILDPANSFTARPFIYHDNLNRSNFYQLIDSSEKIHLTEFTSGKNFHLSVLPIEINTRYNSHHPYGWNDEGMIKSKGLANDITGGIFANLGPLSIQLQPEYVHVANPDYETTAGYGFNAGKSFSKTYLGQSAIRLNLGAVSIAASTENLWWGPGQFSSLLMSNNAAGFEHLSFHTNRPLKTAIGSFEWQLVVGKLKEDTAASFDNNFMKPMNPNPRNDWRYFNGMVITYQPKWLKGLFLGVTRVFHLYGSDFNNQTASLTGKYLPVLGGIFHAKQNVDPNQAPSDQLISLFSRWVFPKYHTEFYFEMGYNDFSYNLRDFTTNQQHSAAYLIGVKKVFLLPKNRFIDFNGELTQMAQMPDYLVRNAGNWYVHGQVTQGYTNQNKIMGAGSGLGNNVQTATINYICGFKKIGIKLQRIQEDPMAISYGTYTNLFLRSEKWSDYSFGLIGQLLVKHQLIINAECQFVNSQNYGWVADNNRFNFYGLLKLSYLW